MKYIMFQINLPICEKAIPVIFPDELVHREIAGALLPVLRNQFDTVKVVSAGYYNPLDGICSGSSETLRVPSRVMDSEIIKTYDYLHGLI